MRTRSPFLATRHSRLITVLLIALFAPPNAPASASDKTAKPSVDEVVAKYLGAMGTADARSAAKSRAAQGTVAFSELVTGNAHLDGKALFRSEGAKLKCVFQFASPQYPGEQFVFDGKNVGVAQIDQQARSMLGGFLVGEPEILSEGLWGGELSTAWPLLDTKASGAKLKYEGLKKIDGRELQEVSYVPKKRTNSGELSVRLYFEPDTFRHVFTVHKLSASPVESGQATDPSTVTTTVEERFGDSRPWTESRFLSSGTSVRVSSLARLRNFSGRSSLRGSRITNSSL
jgi:hypothetical protein